MPCFAPSQKVVSFAYHIIAESRALHKNPGGFRIGGKSLAIGVNPCYWWKILGDWWKICLTVDRAVAKSLDKKEKDL
jgi:hypothetical protein